MSRPNPRNPVAPLLQAKSEIQHFSDEELLELEKDLKSKVKAESGLNPQRVKAFFVLLNKEKSRRGLE